MDYKKLTIEQLIEECLGRPCADAWNEFVCRIQRLIAATATRILRAYGRTDPGLVEEMVQEIYTKIFADDCALLKRFKPQHPNAFLGYLKKITANRVLDHIRKYFPEDEKKVELDEEFEQSRCSNHDELVENEIFFREVDDLLRARGSGPQQEKERNIFWLIHRWGFTAKEIASIPAMELSEEGVESCLFRLRTYLKQSILAKKAKEKQKGVPTPESL